MPRIHTPMIQSGYTKMGTYPSRKKKSFVRKSNSVPVDDPIDYFVPRLPTVLPKEVIIDWTLTDVQISNQLQIDLGTIIKERMRLRMLNKLP